MGVIYIVLPLNAEVAAWLDECDVPNPGATETGRMPTPYEVLAAIEKIPGCESDHKREPSGDFYFTLKHTNERWTTVQMSQFLTLDDPCSLSFHKGWSELAVEVLQRLPSACGPLVFIPDSGEDQVVIVPDRGLAHQSGAASGRNLLSDVTIEQSREAVQHHPSQKVNFVEPTGKHRSFMSSLAWALAFLAGVLLLAGFVSALLGL